MATMADVDELALALPQTTKEVSDDGRPTYFVHGKMFCFHRSARADAVDANTGERLDDVFVFRVADLDDLGVEAWLTRAQKRVAKAWLAEHEPRPSTRPRRAPGRQARSRARTNRRASRR